ncbi:MAG: hypothetical protein K7J47_17095 [Acidobacteria bacterium]|nr:hypothetical protein [Bryobacteraceae bacterium CoA2 C42]
MREFRENLAGYLESGKPLAITRHGETLGFYIPAQKRTGRAGPAPTGEELAPPAGPKRVRCARVPQKRSRKAEVEAMRAAAKDLDAMIATWGASEDELMEEYKEIRQSIREKKRNAK